MSIRRGRAEKCPNVKRTEWVIEDPFETLRNVASQCTDMGRCNILGALRHGLGLAKVPRART